MPKYAFHCRNCHIDFELEMSIDEYKRAEFIRCTNCGSSDTYRIFRKPNIGVKMLGKGYEVIAEDRHIKHP